MYFPQNSALPLPCARSSSRQKKVTSRPADGNSKGHLAVSFAECYTKFSGAASFLPVASFAMCYSWQKLLCRVLHSAKVYQHFLFWLHFAVVPAIESNSQKNTEFTAHMYHTSSNHIYSSRSSQIPQYHTRLDQVN